MQIGSVPTPWPSWMIAAHPTRASDDALRTFLDGLSGHVRTFNSEEKRAKDDVEFIKDKFGYPEEDIKVRRSLLGPLHILSRNSPESCVSRRG